MLKNGSKKGFLIVKLRFAFLPTAFIVYWILVHYRVGSLEIYHPRVKQALSVHYRVGSLEILEKNGTYDDHVHYRVGSLENARSKTGDLPGVHCRVGSLEMTD